MEQFTSHGVADMWNNEQPESMDQENMCGQQLLHG
jgi:hypothetical protein